VGRGSAVARGGRCGAGCVIGRRCHEVPVPPMPDPSAEARPGDHVLVMSNGGFGGLHEKLLTALRAREAK